MKKLFLTLTLLTSLNSHSDVGLIGPDGTSILYYKDGDSIIIKTCDRHTLLGYSHTEARKNCQGNYNNVPVDSLKKSLKKLISKNNLILPKPSASKEEVNEFNQSGKTSDEISSDMDKMKINPEDIEASRIRPKSPEEIKAMVTEFDKINQFRSEYSNSAVDSGKWGSLYQDIELEQKRFNATKKIDAQVERAINFISDQQNLTTIEYIDDYDRDYIRAEYQNRFDNEQFLYRVLRQFVSSSNYPCGLFGSIDERIKDCSYQLNSTKDGFALVTRTEELKEIYKEVSTGLLWSDRLPKTLREYDAEKISHCESHLNILDKSIKQNWRNPTLEETKVAEKSGLWKAIPRRFPSACSSFHVVTNQ